MNIQCLDDIKYLSIKYNIPQEDIIFIALNRYGVQMEYEDNRIRFYLTLNSYEDEFYFAVCVNTYPSPFSIKDNKLFLGEDEIGTISKIERDTCTSTYFRNGLKCMTVNSNRRSNCRGCKFCGTYNLDSEEDENLTKAEVIFDYFNKIIKCNHLKDLSKMENITVCTGCFPSEDELVDHLLILNSSLKRLKFNGKITYIGSQLRSYEKLDIIKKNIESFSLFITTEKFIDREQIMRKEKASLNIQDSLKLADYARNLGFEVSILYILGLENLEVFEKYLFKFVNHINKFPDIQIYQNYISSHEDYRCEEAKDFEYYLKARKIVEKIFKNTNLMPNSWENYRSLFYTEFLDLPYKTTRK